MFFTFATLTLKTFAPSRKGRGEIEVQQKQKGRRSFPRRPSRKRICDQKFLVMRTPSSRGSVVKTLVVSAESSEFRNAPVMAVALNTFFT